MSISTIFGILTVVVFAAWTIGINTVIPHGSTLAYAIEFAFLTLLGIPTAMQRYNSRRS